MNSTTNSNPKQLINEPIDEFLELLCDTNDLASLRVGIQRVLSHPKVFSGFADLMDMPNIQTLFSSETSTEEQKALWNTLELFAYGNMMDYKSAPKGKYLNLTSLQEYKLKQLTIVSLVCTPEPISDRRPSQIPYATLLAAISPTESKQGNDIDHRGLEDILISCIYSNLLHGKLDQRQKLLLLKPPSIKVDSQNNTQFHTPPFISRDVPISSISNMIQSLEQFRTKSQALFSTQLEQALQKHNLTKRMESQMWWDAEQQISQIRSKLHSSVATTGATSNTVNPISNPNVNVNVNANVNMDRRNQMTTGESMSYPRTFKGNRKRYYE